ncbi:hypothetical protein F4677DRAFT_450236 [Hypoxylon crocopeplum]|nr:hypothetical protein F4677DRAFT_450236 [Hypoxylon crocopeplum]
MQLSNILALTSTLVFLPIALAQSACSSTCKACGWFCNQGCSAPLVKSECDRCLYCRRESSACNFIDIGDTWTENPPSKEVCDACDQGCWCHGDWYCSDNTTGPPPPSPPTSTSTGVVMLPTGI